jgi:hypothetical protein
MDMSTIKIWMTNFLVFGISLLAICPTASAQDVFDDAVVDNAPPKAQWRQKVLQSNRNVQQNTMSSAQDTEYRPVERWTSNRNPEQNVEYRTAQRSPYRNSNQDLEYRTAQRTPASNMNRVRPASASSESYQQPKSYRVAQNPVPAELEEMPASTQYEPLASEGVFAQQGASCGADGGDCGECGECVQDCPWMNGCGLGPRVLGIFGGVHGYKGPRDHGLNGNFGFQEGVNYGAPLGDPWGCGYQLGFQALQSNISGSTPTVTNQNNNSTLNSVTADRHQYFFTAGIFRRAENAGWQWGVVFDLLNDTYVQKSDLKQIRTETGYLFNECNEIGYSGAYGVGGDNVNGTYFGRTIDGQLDPTDQFVIYFRRYFENGGDGRIWGGMTGHGDGLFGADAWLPLGGSWALQNNFNYLIPKGSRGSVFNQNDGQLEGAQVKETWSVAINLVWYPGRSSKCLGTSCYRPLLNVADNSLFMVRETTHNTR